MRKKRNIEEFHWPYLIQSDCQRSYLKRKQQDDLHENVNGNTCDIIVKQEINRKFFKRKWNNIVLFPLDSGDKMELKILPLGVFVELFTRKEDIYLFCF